ncbi:MAG: hypothetical protein NC254_12225 [bacterium]|nr:hypothetical protein [bacterium]
MAHRLRICCAEAVHDRVGCRMEQSRGGHVSGGAKRDYHTVYVMRFAND